MFVKIHISPKNSNREKGDKPSSAEDIVIINVDAPLKSLIILQIKFITSFILPFTLLCIVAFLIIFNLFEEYKSIIHSISEQIGLLPERGPIRKIIY